MIVVDASAAICLLLNQPAQRAYAVGSRLWGEVLHAPHLLDIEVAHTLRRFVLTGGLNPVTAAATLTNLEQLRLVRHPHYPMLQQIWALRANLTDYDAAYVALAASLQVPLITLDARLARSGAPIQVELF